MRKEREGVEYRRLTLRVSSRPHSDLNNNYLKKMQVLLRSSTCGVSCDAAAALRSNSGRRERFVFLQHITPSCSFHSFFLFDASFGSAPNNFWWRHCMSPDTFYNLLLITFSTGTCCASPSVFSALRNGPSVLGKLYRPVHPVRCVPTTTERQTAATWCRELVIVMRTGNRWTPDWNSLSSVSTASKASFLSTEEV